MDIHISPEHQPQFTRWQHVGEHLAAERQRLEAELRYVTQQAQQLDTHLTAFLQQTYAVDARKQRVQLDVERGVIVLPDVQPATASPLPEEPPTEDANTNEND